MKRILPCVVVCACLVVAAGCGCPCADSGGKHHPKGAMFEKMDANGDGAVSRDEVLACRTKHFARADADGDGAMSKAEFDGMMHPRLAKQDANGDGLATREENLAFFVGAKQAASAKDIKATQINDAPLFDRADANDDDALSADEMAAEIIMWHEETDTDGDDKLSLDEHKARMDWLFVRIDADKDGKLTKEEFVTFQTGK